MNGKESELIDNNDGNVVDNAVKNTGQAISDTAITSKVRVAILAERGLKVMQIMVATSDGMVTLTGKVNAQMYRDKAATIASHVDGVNGVNNRLWVKPLWVTSGSSG